MNGQDLDNPDLVNKDGSKVDWVEVFPDSYEYLYFVAVITNNTNEDFSVDSCGLSWGKWGFYPVKASKNKCEGYFRALGRDSAMSGTEGWVKYKSDTTSKIITINFDVPYKGSSSQSVDFDKNSYNVTAEVSKNKDGAMVVNYTIKPV